MPVYISLLRGINVGGQKIIPMVDLRNTFESIGFSNVKTHIQSGNVAFASRRKNLREMENDVKAAIKKRFGFDVGVTVLGLIDLEKIVSMNPFGKEKLKSGERIYLTVLSGRPYSERIVGLRRIKDGVDKIQVIDTTVYVLCRKGYTMSPFNNNAIEKTLQVGATTRNLETMEKLVEIGRGLDSN